jgi:exo-beta-1,3-glucanase (GH17 family)
MKKIITIFLAFMFMLAASGCTLQKKIHQKVDLLSDEWPGYALSYSGYRAGQDPREHIYPTQEQILEDLKIIEKNWRLIRVYGADQHSRDVLEVIRREKLNLSVMLGIWLDGNPGFEEANERQLNTGIQLANEFKNIVCAVNVGNEILVSWSNHRMTEDHAIEYVRRVRQAVSVPVTIADDILFWRDNGERVARELDFIAMHTYPMWGGSDIDSAMQITIRHYNSVRQAIPDKKIIISEAGWATYTVGEMHAPRAGDEIKQKRYFNELMDWAKTNNVIVFFFEAFDEPWKGTGTEGHWGLFSVDRKAKVAMQEWYPELMPDGPTSPSYE